MNSLLWSLWQDSLAPWLAALTAQVPLSAAAPDWLPDPLALARCLLAHEPEHNWPAKVLPVFEAWPARASAAADSAARIFWLDLLAALLAQQPESTSGIAPGTAPDALSLPDFGPPLLLALMLAAPAPASSSQQLNQIYAHWRALTPHKLTEAKAHAGPLNARLLLHLLAFSLGHYATENPAGAAGIKPLLVVWLQRWFSQPLADQCQALPAGWQGLPGRAGTGYGWLVHLQQQARAIDEALSFPQRNAVFQALEQSDGSPAALQHTVAKFMNRQLQRDNPLALGWLDSLIRETGPRPGGPAQATGYRLLDAAALDGGATETGGNRSVPLPERVRVLPEWDAKSYRWQSWQACPADHPAREAASSYPAALAHYWQQPGPQAFARWGSQDRFRTRWVPDGELGLYQLLDVLLQVCENSGSTEALPRENMICHLIDLQLLQSDAAGLLMARPRYHALIDACERLLCPARTGAAEAHPLQALLAPLYPGPVVDSSQIQRFVLACTSWCPPPGLSLQVFRSQICPLESYRAEAIARSASPVICHSFLAPFSYLRDESSGQNLPAAFVSGGCYQLDPPDSRPLPFVASQYQHHAAAATPLLRLVFDHLLLNAQREAARYRQHLSEQAAREAHYLQLRQHLQDYQRQQQALQSAWQQIQQALEAPFLQRLGLHSQGVLETLFRSEAQLGYTASGRPLRASHRPGYLQQHADLSAYLCYAASGDPALPPPAWPGSLPAALWRWSQQLLPEDTDAARRGFGWFKLNSYDAWLPGSGGYLLQLGQLVQALWLAKQALITLGGPALILQWQQATGDSLDLSPLLQGSLDQLLASQPRLCGLDFARPDADTRQARPALALYGPALAFCQQLQALLQHLQGEADSNRVQLERCEARWISGPTGEGLQLRLFCTGHFTPAALEALRSPLQSGGSHDLRQLLQDLHSILSGSDSLWSLHRGAPADREACTASASAQTLRPGLSLWQLPETRSGRQSLLQLCAGTLTPAAQGLAGAGFLDQGRSTRWQALGLQNLRPLLTQGQSPLSSADWRHWLAQQSAGLLVLHLHEHSSGGDYLLLDPAWLQDLPPGLQVLLVSGGESEALAHWLAQARQAFPAVADQLQLYPEDLSAEAAVRPSELEQLGWQQLLKQLHSQQPLNLGVFDRLRQLLVLLEAWEDSDFATDGPAWEALQAVTDPWPLPAERLHSLPHDSLAAWRVWLRVYSILS